jgi:cytochrome c biogenesis protein
MRDAAPLDTRPDEGDIVQPRLGPLGWVRWAWRQLTSMRTALFLLLLLAIAAVPGSVWPQRGIDPGRVADYLTRHRSVGPALDRLGFFDVYSSPWFAAIYLLLFVSLVGCVLPRSRIHWRALRAQPPRAPARLHRLPEHAETEVDGTLQDVRAVAQQVLRAGHYRVRSSEPDALSAENGYLRETGNLVFHAALLVVIVGIAVGHLFGWRGDVIVPTGQSFANTAARYDTLDPGPLVDLRTLQPFSVSVDKMDVTFEEQAGGAQRGAPRDFTVYTTTQARPGAPKVRQVLKVNHPLTFGRASLFLLGNGYAPVISIHSTSGALLFHDAVPFLAQDNNYRSVGAIKVISAKPELGLQGVFLPTAVFVNGSPTSVFPALKRPGLLLGLYEGTLFPGGRPQSVYSLDTTQMSPVTATNGKPLLLSLQPGQTVTLPGGRGSVTFDGVRRFAGLSVRYDPGKSLALWGALAALAGLVCSLTIRRRRVFVRVRPAPGFEAAHDGPGSARPGARTLVTIGGLAKGEDARLGSTVQHLLDTIAERTATTQPVRRTGPASAAAAEPAEHDWSTRPDEDRHTMSTDRR